MAFLEGKSVISDDGLLETSIGKK